MRTRFARLLVATAVGTLLVFQWAEARAAEQPGLAGFWKLNAGQSDDLRAAVAAAAGPAHTQKGSKEEVDRVLVRSLLLEAATRPDAEALQIELTSETFKTGVGSNVRVYYFGRVHARQGQAGDLRKATVNWDGAQIRTEEKGKDSRLEEVYSLLPETGQLRVTLRVETKLFKKPLEARVVFDRVPSEP
jgi:hypothetical protein